MFLDFMMFIIPNEAFKSLPSAVQIACKSVSFEASIGANPAQSVRFW
jgi:hypothetical protein